MIKDFFIVPQFGLLWCINFIVNDYFVHPGLWSAAAGRAGAAKALCSGFAEVSQVLLLHVLSLNCKIVLQQL